jgi:hypothetical protein
MLAGQSLPSGYRIAGDLRTGKSTLDEFVPSAIE